MKGMHVSQNHCSHDDQAEINQGLMSTISEGNRMRSKCGGETSATWILLSDTICSVLMDDSSHPCMIVQMFGIM